jgi:hypothetical protein
MRHGFTDCVLSAASLGLAVSDSDLRDNRPSSLPLDSTDVVRAVVLGLCWAVTGTEERGFFSQLRLHRMRAKLVDIATVSKGLNLDRTMEWSTRACTW